MVLASPSASQTCRLASDFKACFDLNDNKLIIVTAYFANGVSESLMKFRNLFLVLKIQYKRFLIILAIVMLIILAIVM